MNRENAADPHGYQASGSATIVGTGRSPGHVRASNQPDPDGHGWTRD